MAEYIDANKTVTIQVYDDMTEEWHKEKVTIAEALDKWTDEGCPKSVEIEPFKDFAEWVASEVCTMDFEDRWSLGAFAERACRKLWVLGVVQKFRDEWVYVDKDKLDGEENG